jgi:hypothetical protein
LAVGVTVGRWHDLMSLLVEDALAVLENEPAVAHVLPLEGDNSEGEAARCAFEAMAETLSRQMTLVRGKNLIERHISLQCDSSRPGQFTDLARIGELNAQSRVGLRDGTLVCVDRRDDTLELTFRRKSLVLPASAEPAVQFLLDNRSFRIAELLGFKSDEERLTFAAGLIKEGLLVTLEP